MSLPRCLWFLFYWKILNAKDSEEKEAGECGICFHCIFMYFLNVVFIDGIQYKPQEFCERNGFANDEERFFFSRRLMWLLLRFLVVCFLTVFKISPEQSTEFFLSPPKTKSWFPAGSFPWLISCGSRDLCSCLVVPIGYVPLQLCWWLLLRRADGINQEEVFCGLQCLV